MAIDLEHFPTNETAIRMMERISPIYDRSYVGKWIFEIMGTEMEETRAYFEELYQQPFPERTTWAIEYWERRYAIVPKPIDDLETRRRRIIMKRGYRLPMNPARMEQIVNGLTGGDTVVTENVDEYTFSIYIENPSPNMDTIGVLKEVKKRKPSHQNIRMVFITFCRGPILLHVGGRGGIQSALGLPEDTAPPERSGVLYAGGAMSGRTSLPVPEDTAPPPATTILHTGGVCTILSNLSGRD